MTRASEPRRPKTLPTHYPVQEQFYSWQGEGMHLGRAAYFIRMYGCPQACTWCDSAGTWHPAYRPQHLPLRSAEDLTLAVQRDSPDHSVVVLTGGEPVLFDLAPLTRALHERGRAVHLETSGIAPLRGEVDWVTLSPKPAGMPPRADIVRRADEIKIVVHHPSDIAAGLDSVSERRPDALVWLHPEWSRARDQDARVLNAITEAVKTRPGLRAGYQAHKLYRADEQDDGSDRRAVPLGGNPDLGY